MADDGLSKGVKGLKDTFLLCRFKRHAWKVGSVRSADGMIVVQMMCRDCAVIKYQTLDRTGVIEGNRYEYPDGYLVREKDGGRIQNVDVRLEVVKRMRGKGGK